MAFFTDGVVPWNSLDDNIRAPTTAEKQNGYPCGEADRQLFNFTTSYSWGQVHNAILDAGLTPNEADLTQLSQAVAMMIRNTVPAGAGMVWYADAPPTGWLEADGALLSRSAYADLFAVIGTTFGAGDGATTFALPDLRGEFLRGWDHGRGVDSGRALGSYQKGTMVGGYDDNDDAASISLLPGKDFRDYGGDPVYSGEYPLSSVVYGETPRQYSAGSFDSWYSVTRPRNIATMFIIKY